MRGAPDACAAHACSSRSSCGHGMGSTLGLPWPALAWAVVPASACRCRDEDHLALFMELLGRIPWRVSSAGTNAREFFNSRGELRHIKRLHHWPLHEVLHQKYGFPSDEVRPQTAGLTQRRAGRRCAGTPERWCLALHWARLCADCIQSLLHALPGRACRGQLDMHAQADAMAAFLLPMLRYDPDERATAAQMLQHSWLSSAGAPADALVANGRSADHHRSRSPSPPAKRWALRLLRQAAWPAPATLEAAASAGPLLAEGWQVVGLAACQPQLPGTARPAEAPPHSRTLVSTAASNTRGCAAAADAVESVRLWAPGGRCFALHLRRCARPPPPRGAAPGPFCQRPGGPRG